MVPVIIAIVAVLVVVALVVGLVLKAKKDSRDVVLLCGVSGSGKSLLFSQLIGGKFLETHTSIAENSAPLPSSSDSKSLQVVDVPGHPRLFRGMLEKYAKRTRNVVFVIDSQEFSHQVRDVSEYLYDLFAHPSLPQNIPFLILCNKQDIWTSSKPDDVRAAVEKEITTLRKTRHGAVGGDTSAFLGIKGEDFKMEHLNRVVEFQEFSAKGKLIPPDTERVVEKEPLLSWITSPAH